MNMKKFSTNSGLPLNLARSSGFWVATPTYYQERQVDPWIVGEIGGGADRWAVIARWD